MTIPIPYIVNTLDEVGSQDLFFWNKYHLIFYGYMQFSLSIFTWMTNFALIDFVSKLFQQKIF
jgi:hypothetical protein